MCNARAGQHADVVGTRSATLITLISHSCFCCACGCSWVRIGNFPHFHTQTLPANAKKSTRRRRLRCCDASHQSAGRTPKPNHKNALIRKRGAKNYIHTHTQTEWHTYCPLAIPNAHNDCRPITEFVYESPGKSNTKKMLTAAQRWQKYKERRSFCAIFPHTASNGRRVLALSLACSLAHSLALS